jgi:HAE1 family hydrophobic/amphiphilic exporter-1
MDQRRPDKVPARRFRRWKNCPRRLLPQGYTFAWTGLSLEEIESGGQVVLLFALGLLVVYLTLGGSVRKLVAALHRHSCGSDGDWARCLAQSLRGLINDIYCQVGLVMLIGLSSKNAILIVEFAEQLRQRGLSIVQKPRSKQRESACVRS